MFYDIIISTNIYEMELFKMFNNKQIGLNNNQLKIIAMISMILDHVGLTFFPQIELFGILGRLALPIYAYMIAEGCAHTRNRKKYLGMILGMGIIFQLVYLVFMNDLYQGILITFSLSIGMIYAVEGFLKNNKPLYRILMILVILGILFFDIGFPILFKKHGFNVDYGVWGLLLPVVIYFMPNKTSKLICGTIFLSAMAYFSIRRQWFALLSIPILALYNGKRGKRNMKYFFYIAYPLHLVIIYGIMFLMTIIK